MSGVNIIEKIGVNSNAYKKEKGRYKPRGLMAHSVGTPQPRASVFADKWGRTGSDGGIQYVLDPNEVYHCYPDNYVGWHAGGSANATHIGVETCEPDTITYTGGASFRDNDPEKTKTYVDGVYAKAVAFFAYKCQEYGFDPLQDGVIISHDEGRRRGVASAHYDPDHLWTKYGYTMDGFRRDIAALLQGGEVLIPAPTPTEKPMIKRGSTGAYVVDAQTKLIARGFSCGAAGADGIFGAGTEAGVKAFQRASGLSADGIIGPLTWAKLDADNAPSPAPSTDYVTYVIQPGDTLWALAKQHNTTVAILCGLNGIADPAVIKAGQTIRIPA